MTITPSGSPASLTIAKDTTWTADIDGITYKYVTPNATVVSRSSSNTYSANIQVVEGEPLTHKFTVSTSSPLRYILPNKNVDDRSVTIQIQTSSSNAAVRTFVKVSNLYEVNSTSQIFYHQEYANNQMEVTFGDGVLGMALDDGNIVIADYRVCHGTDTNGANTFTNPSTVAGESTFSVNVLSKAAGGANSENIDSIKFNAPKMLEVQHRAVTAEDYRRLIVAEYPDIQALSVWGGEENSPPIYGKVYIAGKPINQNTISTDRQTTIKDFLKKRNVLSIDPEFVDPNYLFIVPTIVCRYDPGLTTISAGAINTKIQNEVIAFETAKLNNFGTKFVYSRFMNAVETADPSIVSALIGVNMEKRFIPATSTITTYKLSFNNPIGNPDSDVVSFSENITASGHTAHKGQHFITSSKFTYNGFTNCQLEDDGEGVILIYYTVGQRRVYLNDSAGTVNYDTGLITLNQILIAGYEGTSLHVTAKPQSNDIASVRNLIPLIADSKIVVVNDDTGATESTVDVVSTGGQSLSVTETGVNTLVI